MLLDGWNILTNSGANDRALQRLRASARMRDMRDGGKVLFSSSYAPLFKPFTHAAIKGGRGTAKTTHVATYIALRMDAGFVTVCGLRKHLISIRQSSKRAIERAIYRLGLQDRFDIQHLVIKNKVTGSEVFFRGLDSDADETTRGLDGVDIFWIDEARNVTGVALNLVIQVLRERGAQLITTWNPLDPEDAVEQLYFSGKPPANTLLIHTTQEDNPAFFASPAADNYWRMKQYDEPQWRNVYGGEFDVTGGERVYSKVEIGTLPYQYLADETPCFGLDLGYKDDPSVATKTWVLEKPRVIYVEREAVGYGEDVQGIAELLDIVGAQDFPVIADNSEQRTTDALRDMGHNIVVTQKNVIGKSVVEGIRHINGYRIIVNPQCVETIDETKHYKWKVDKNTGKTTRQPRKGYDHSWDSIRYAVMAREPVDEDEGVFTVPGF